MESISDDFQVIRKQIAEDISLSADGTIVAIGGKDTRLSMVERVATHEFINIHLDQNQLGNDIQGEAADDESGYAVNLLPTGR